MINRCRENLKVALLCPSLLVTVELLARVARSWTSAMELCDDAQTDSDKHRFASILCCNSSLALVVLSQLLNSTYASDRSDQPNIGPARTATITPPDNTGVRMLDVLFPASVSVNQTLVRG